MKTIYHATRPDDEGRRSEEVGFFFNLQDAQRAAALSDSWQQGGNVIGRDIYESFDEWILESNTWAAKTARKRIAEANRESDPESYAQYLELKKRFGD